MNKYSHKETIDAEKIDIDFLSPFEEVAEEVPEDFKELEQILDESIKEVEIKNTKPLKELLDQLPYPKKEEYKLNKEDVHEIKNFLIHLKDINIEAKNNSYKSMIEILRETHFIKKSQSANNKTTYGLMFLAGAAFGMADAKWMPFAKVIYDFFSTIIGKG